MADLKITELTSYSAIADTDVVPIVDMGTTTTKKTTWSSIKTVLKAYFSTRKDFVAGETITTGQPMTLLPYPVNQVLYDNGTAGNATAGSAAPISFSFTVAANSNRKMIVITSDPGVTPNNDIGSVKYNGVSFAEQSWVSSGQYAGVVYTRAQGWILDAPATGANTLLITPQSATTRDIKYIVFSFYNVDTCTTVTSDSHTSGAPSTINLSVTPTVNCSAVFAAYVGTLSSTDIIVNNTQNAESGQLIGGWCDPVAPMAVRVLNLSSSGNAAIAIQMTPVLTSATGRVYKSSSTTTGLSGGFIGFAENAASVTQTVDVVMEGVESNQSGLIAGTQYYINDTAGTIGSSVGTVTRKCGIALDATNLRITDIW